MGPPRSLVGKTALVFTGNCGPAAQPGICEKKDPGRTKTLEGSRGKETANHLRRLCQDRRHKAVAGPTQGGGGPG